MREACKTSLPCNNEKGCRFIEHGRTSFAIQQSFNKEGRSEGLPFVEEEKLRVLTRSNEMCPNDRQKET